MSRRNPIVCAAAVLSLALLPVAVWAQAPVVGPGDPSIDGRLIKAGTYAFAMTATTSGKTLDLGTMTYETTALVINGDSVWRLVQRVETKLGNSTDTVVVARSTLAPRSLRGFSPEGSITLTYNGVKITGEHRDPEGSAQAVALTLARTAFDDSSSDLVLAALPFKTGYAVRLPMFAYESGVTMNEVTVLGETTVNGVSAWSVEMVTQDGTLTYAFSKADHSTLGATMNTVGLTITMTLVKR